MPGFYTTKKKTTIGSSEATTEGDTVHQHPSERTTALEQEANTTGRYTNPGISSSMHNVISGVTTSTESTLGVTDQPNPMVIEELKSPSMIYGVTNPSKMVPQSSDPTNSVVNKVFTSLCAFALAIRDIDEGLIFYNKVGQAPANSSYIRDLICKPNSTHQNVSHMNHISPRVSNPKETLSILPS